MASPQIDSQTVAKIEKLLDLEYTSHVPASSKPVGHILGGAPASGKSTLIQRILSENEGHRFVLINGDELRRYHPAFSSLNNLDDRKAADATQGFANALASYLQHHCIKYRKSFIIEGTMRNSTVPCATAELLRKNSFRSEAHIIAAPFEITSLRAFKRYLQGVRLHGHGRFSNLEVQKEAYEKLAASAEKVSAVVDVSHVYRLDATSLVGSFSNGSHISSIIQGLQAPLQGDERKNIALEWATVHAEMQAINRYDPFPVNQIRTLLDGLSDSDPVLRAVKEKGIHL